MQLIAQPPAVIEGAAGSLHVEIPTALIARQRDGLLETVGVGSMLVEDERPSIIIELPPGADTELIGLARNVPEKSFAR